MQLPILHDPIWVDRPAAFHQMVKKLASFPILGVDTESNSLHAYQEQVCLIQFSTPDETDYLVDPLALDNILELGAVFSNPAIEKIFHAAEYDVICLKRDFGFKFASLFDTMVAARILGRQAVGLGAMLETEFGIQTDKRYQRADWGLRPLPHAQIDYARMDTHYLVPLRDRLRAELEASDRWPLAIEDFHRMTQVNGHNGEVNLQENLWRISGSQDLTPQQAAILHDLNAFRDEMARVSNNPPFKVLSNQVLLQLAQNAPQTKGELADLGVLTDRQLKRYGPGLLKAIEHGLTAQPLRRPSSPRPSDKFLLRLDALRNWRKQTAQAMGVESDVILPRDLLHSLAERAPHSQDELRDIMHTTPWRYQQFGGQIAKLLAVGDER